MLLRYNVYRLFWQSICSLIFAAIYSPTISCFRFDEQRQTNNTLNSDKSYVLDFANQEQNRLSAPNPDDIRREQFLSHEVLSMFQMHMLSKLGMKERPAKRETPAEVPDIFRAMYNRLNDGTVVINGDVESDTDSVVGEQSFWDSARGYPMEGFRIVDPQAPSSSFANTRYELTFNVTNFAEEKIESSQLALMLNALPMNANSDVRYKNNDDNGQTRTDNVDDIRPGDSSPPPHIFISVSRFARNHTIVLDARRVSCAASNRWETFKVDSAVRHWFASGRNKNDDGVVGRLAVDVRGAACGIHLAEAPSMTSSTSSGLDSSTAAPPPPKHLSRFRPSLIVYTWTQQSRQRPKREAKRRGKKQRNGGRRHNQLHSSSGRRQACARHSLTIDFESVGWSDWVMAPPSYDAYYCAGSCAWPLPQGANATNHAIMQSLAHSINPRAVPRPSCVPVELGQISMLYVDHYQRIVVKVYHDMIVLGCGCR